TNLVVYPEKMLRNLEMTNGLIFSQSILLELAKKGLTREEAYGLVQKRAMQVWESGGDFKERILSDSEIRSHLSEEEIESCFDLDKNLANVDFIFKRVGLAN
ncbi:MAG: adenylosuccinate lyase, partial [bacterium]